MNKKYSKFNQIFSPMLFEDKECFCFLSIRALNCDFVFDRTTHMCIIYIQPVLTFGFKAPKYKNPDWHIVHHNDYKDVYRSCEEHFNWIFIGPLKTCLRTFRGALPLFKDPWFR